MWALLMFNVASYVSVVINIFLVGILGKATTCSHTPRVTTGLFSNVVMYI